MTFSDKMLETIRKYRMLENGSSVLVALSGGADSVSLLLGLLELKDKLELKISAAHVNHMLRGDDADNDMKFAEELCRKHGVVLHTLKKDINEYSRVNKCSLEDGGRRVRYEFFSELTKKENSVIATAHTKDDNSENFFITALRGTRVMGIPPKRDNIIRPLINTTKAEIYAYLEEKNQSFCVDKTNFSEDYFRNKVRLKLIPFINSEFETDISETLKNNLDVMDSENDFLNGVAEEFINNNCEMKNSSAVLDIDKINECHKAVKRRIIRNIYYRISDGGYISFLHTDNIIKLIGEKQTGKKLPLCKNIIAEISYNSLIIRKSEKSASYSYEINLGETLKIAEAGIQITLDDEKNKNAFFCSEDSKFTVRTRKNGDKITLKGGHHKKLSDFFTDKKIPRGERDKIPVITDSDGICAVGNLYLRKENSKNKVYIHISEEQ